MLDFDYDTENQTVTIKIDHSYDEKMITASMNFERWIDDMTKFADKLTEAGISEHHVNLICDSLRNDQERIHTAVQKTQAANKKAADKAAKDDRQQFRVFKYSNNFKGPLYEAIMLNGQPMFMSYDIDMGKISVVAKIEEATRVLYPPQAHVYANDGAAYEFATMEEIEYYLDRARNSTIFSLYEIAKAITRRYNDQTEELILLCAIDMIASYFQDRFSTVHYDILTGITGAGKSAWAETFLTGCYRGAYFVEPTAAVLYRMLGQVERGQCVMIIDEADKIFDNALVINIIKAGYSTSAKVPRTNDKTLEVDWFYPFCIKIILAEKITKIVDAKGVRDRSFERKAYKGDPKFDIKEDKSAATAAGNGNSNSNGNGERDDDEDAQQRYGELIDFRKTAMLYRMIHFNDKIPDIDIGFTGREKELVKPYLRLFFKDTKPEDYDKPNAMQTEIISTFETLLGLRKNLNETTIESELLRILLEVLGEDGVTLTSQDYWDKLKQTLTGVEVEKNKYETDEYGPIWRNTVGSILSQSFGGERSHTSKGNTYHFDRNRLHKLKLGYGTTLKIKVKQVKHLKHYNESQAQKTQENTSKNGQSERESTPQNHEKDPKNSQGTNNGASGASGASPPSTITVDHTDTSSGFEDIERLLFDRWKGKEISKEDGKETEVS